MSSEQRLFDSGPITSIMHKIFELAKRLSLTNLLNKFSKRKLFRPRSELTQAEINNKEFTESRARAIDLYMISWLAIEIICALLSCLPPVKLPVRISIIIIILLRLIEIIQVTVNTSLFDTIGRPDGLVASRARMVLLSGINFLELAICFGVVYALNLEFLHGAANLPSTAFYFSIITQLTIGYGDIYPMNWLRIVAPVQGLVSLLFVVLVFVRFISSLPPTKSLFD